MVFLNSTIDIDQDINDPVEFILIISVSDNETNPLTSTTTVHITINPENEHFPIFSPGNLESLNINEGTPISSSLHRLVATDKDYGEDGEISFEIINGNSAKIIVLDPHNGIIYLARKLDYDNPLFNPKYYEFQIRASDSSSSSKKSTTGTFTIFIEDLGDLAPVCDLYAISTNLLENTTSGQLVI